MRLRSCLFVLSVFFLSSVAAAADALKGGKSGAPTPVRYGDIVTDALAPGAEKSGLRYIHFFKFAGRAGDQVKLSMLSNDVDMFFSIRRHSIGGALVANNYSYEKGGVIPEISGTLPADDEYFIQVQTQEILPAGTYPYSIGLSTPSQPLRSLSAHRPTRGRIGVQISEVPVERATAIGLPKPMGALVDAIAPNGPAATGGIKVGDIILKIGAHVVQSPISITSVVAKTKPGAQLPVTVWRDQANHYLDVMVAEAPDTGADCMVINPSLVGRYEGPCKDGYAHGHGTAIGTEYAYTGDFHAGELHGKGVYTGPNNSRYEGEFENGHRHGRGVHVVDGTRYEGEWKNGRRHGSGVEIRSNGERIEGEFRHGQFSGPVTAQSVAQGSAATHPAVTNASPAANGGQDMSVRHPSSEKIDRSPEAAADKLRQDQKEASVAKQGDGRAPSLAAPGTSTLKRPEEAKVAKKGGGKVGGTNGRYVIPASGYSIQVDFGAGTLTVSEPNKTSVYREASPGVYHFTNPTNGIKYGMKVIDEKTIEAFKPQSRQPGTRLTLAGTGEQEEKPGSRSVQSTVIKGKTVFYTSDTPEDIAEHLYGTYLYEKEGEPIVILERDGTGYFQPHGQPKIRINYWLQSSESGKVERVTGQGTPNYQVVLVVQFVNSNNSLYPSNSFRRFQLTMNITGGYAIILGERFKPLKQ